MHRTAHRPDRPPASSGRGAADSLFTSGAAQRWRVRWGRTLVTHTYTRRSVTNCGTRQTPSRAASELAEHNTVTTRAHDSADRLIGQGRSVKVRVESRGPHQHRSPPHVSPQQGRRQARGRRGRGRVGSLPAPEREGERSCQLSTVHGSRAANS